MMEVVDRKDNPLLHRVEIRFSWRHAQAATPSRNEIIDAVTKLEPGAVKSLVIVKDVNTRYGQALTTGLAYVYASDEALSIEPTFQRKRHGLATDDAEGDA